MGSSDGPSNNIKAIDSSVGGLVWVRRRNGTWWPGRIMGVDEISEGSLVSPRSGTPVKLLGREDASVDWYNLEKSKRVKAFRCGEYDECIEKAKASAANGNKKAVKYARREDAILHALEIENALLGKDRLDLFSRTNNSGGEHESLGKESSSMSLSGKDMYMTGEESGSDDSGDDSKTESDSDSGLDSDSDSAPASSQSGEPCEQPNNIGASKVQSVQGNRRKTPNDSEDDGTEGIKRMRGLEDLGMGVGDSNTGNGVCNGSPANGKGYNFSLKRKRSQVAHVHEFLKRKNRRRTLTKVLDSTAMVSVPVICDQLPSSSGSPHRGVSDNKVSGLESNESKKGSCVVNNNSNSIGVLCDNGSSIKKENGITGTTGLAENDSHVKNEVKKDNGTTSTTELVENDSSNKLFDVPFLGEEKHTGGFSPLFLPSSSGKNQATGLGKQSSQSSQAEALSLKNEGLNEYASASSPVTHVDNNISQGIEKGTSKWQLKRKRNSRHINRNRKLDTREYADIDDESDAYLASLDHLDGFLQGSESSDQKVSSYNCNLQVRSKPFTEHPVNGIRDWGKSSANGIREWGKSFSPRETQMRGLAAEVPFLPQRSLPYRQSCFTINSRYQTSDFPGRSFYTGSRLFDVKVEVKVNYRPQHVPLVSLTSKLNGKAIVGHPLTIESLDDGYCDPIISSNQGNVTQVAFLEAAKHGFAAVPNPDAGRVLAKLMIPRRLSPGKSSKLKKSGLLSKKIRKLSSLTGRKEEVRRLVVDKPKGPVIACIPLNLVFSRINETLNGTGR